MSAAANRLAASVWGALDLASTRRISLIGAALVRVGFGATMLYVYAVHYRDRAYLWGPGGVWEWSSFQAQPTPSLYALTDSAAGFEVIFHLGMLCTAAFMLGWHTRLVTPLMWMFTWSLQQRNPMILDGGDNLMILVLVYLMVVDTGSHLAVGAASRHEELAAGVRERFSYRIATLFHNAGTAAIVLQVVVVYWASGMYKVQGELWQNGTALYYIMRVSEFTWPGWSELVWRNGLAVGVLTHATVLFQLAFPLLLLRRETRVLAVLGGISLHTGIAVFMGLITFSAVMISVELVLISDHRYRQIARLARGVIARVGEAALKSPLPGPDTAGWEHRAAGVGQGGRTGFGWRRWSATSSSPSPRTWRR